MARQGAEKILAEFADQMKAIGVAAEKRAQLTASGYARGKRVKVTVNADGVVIETKFAGDISELDYDEVAKAVTAAAQEAAAEVARLSAEVLAPVVEKRARMPKLSDLIDGMPDFQTNVPRPTVSTAPPNAPERTVTDGTAPGFEGVEDHDAWVEQQRGSGVLGKEGW
ncbi:YbaB/EbfC family nucleoid-associated protein [Nocardia sp. NPDC050712]|uniref:YbaB/EbfC family nucleoid-associated protein n=1 Tax=Nocardia sp. NPDC050712 TaxID=3155518 RepID=UPI00340FAC33